MSLQALEGLIAPVHVPEYFSSLEEIIHLLGTPPDHLYSHCLVEASLEAIARLDEATGNTEYCAQSEFANAFRQCNEEFCIGAW